MSKNNLEAWASADPYKLYFLNHMQAIQSTNWTIPTDVLTNENVASQYYNDQNQFVDFSANKHVLISDPSNQSSATEYLANEGSIELPNQTKELDRTLNQYHTNLSVNSFRTLLDILLNSRGKVTISVD